MDLVAIPLRGNKVIVGMDWLSPNGEMIDCEQLLVRVRTPSGGGLVIPGKRPQHEPTLCLIARARHDLQQGCTGYVAYIVDTRDKGKAIVDDILIVREYPNMFPKDLPGVPPERQVEIRIDLVLSAASIARHHIGWLLTRYRSCLHSYKIC